MFSALSQILALAIMARVKSKYGKLMPRVMQSPRHEEGLKLKLQRLLHKGFITIHTLILLYPALIHLFP